MTQTKEVSGARARKAQAYASAREVLLRCGMELLTEQGFSATGLEAVLKRATVPKGSFYYYFASKEAFGREVMDAYDAYFGKKLDRWLQDGSRAPLDRLMDFVADASAGMRKHEFRRGCLVGNLSQELGALPRPIEPGSMRSSRDGSARLPRACARRSCRAQSRPGWIATSWPSFSGSPGRAPCCALACFETTSRFGTSSRRSSWRSGCAPSVAARFPFHQPTIFSRTESCSKPS